MEPHTFRNALKSDSARPGKPDQRIARRETHGGVGSPLGIEPYRHGLSRNRKTMAAAGHVDECGGRSEYFG